jgi:hypothetical protein
VAAFKADTRRRARGTTVAPVPNEGTSMDTFFVRKQLIAGGILLVCIEVGFMVIRALAR